MFFSYPIIYIAGIIFQILFIIHALKTNRRDLLYMLIFFPLVGAVVYFIMEILPEISRGEFIANLGKIIFPNKRIREMERKFRLADTVTNKLNLAETYAEQKKYDKAIVLAEECLTDPYINHAGIYLKLARLFFYNGQYEKSLELFKKAKNNNYNKLDRPEDELMYSRSLDYTGSIEQAEEEYKTVIRVHHSLEARYHYGILLKKLSRHTEALEQFTAVRKEKDLHPRYVRRLNSQWIRLSKIELKTKAA